MSWTNWRLRAQRNDWFDENFDYDGPVCYELSITGPHGGGRKIMYCGHTENEKRRMSSYGRDGSHLADIIRQHLRDGWCLCYRGYALKSKKQAEAMERRMLGKFKYGWNILLNC